MHRLDQEEGMSAPSVIALSAIGAPGRDQRTVGGRFRWANWPVEVGGRCPPSLAANMWGRRTSALDCP